MQTVDENLNFLILKLSEERKEKLDTAVFNFPFAKRFSIARAYMNLRPAKELSEEAEGYEKVGNIQEKENTLRQKQIIEKYLPKMMSEKEIRNVISSLEDKSIPNIMKYFKQNYAGKCDMKAVSDIAKTF